MNETCTPSQRADPRLVIGVGAGPANLGLAALSQSLPDPAFTVRLLDRRATLDWHMDQCLPGTTLQNSWLRDLVLAADPTSQYTFLNYLHHNCRLQRFLTTGITAPSRVEISDYFNWVAERLGTVQHPTEVAALRYDAKEDQFAVTLVTNGAESLVAAHAVSVGTGTVPTLFHGRAYCDTPRVVYAHEMANEPLLATAERVLVVGGGQSGAEAVLHLLTARPQGSTPQVTWITRAAGFHCLDTTGPSSEFYAYGFPNAFAALDPFLRSRINHEGAASGSGISPSTMEKIFEALYGLAIVGGNREQVMHPLTDLIDLHITPETVSAQLRFASSESTHNIQVELVILCLGHRATSRQVACNLLETALLEPAPDYSVSSGSIPPGRVFVQSDSVATHGFGDTNYVSAPHRNATILNRLAGRQVFAIPTEDRFATYRAPNRNEPT